MRLPRFRFVSHSKRAIRIAVRHGWLPGARYTNLRDIRTFDRLGFLDIDWKNYNFLSHLKAARLTRPIMTVARDVEDISHLDQILLQAKELNRYCNYVVIVPKDKSLISKIDELIPQEFLLGFSVPTKYGGTCIPVCEFRRPVHILGGRPEVQRRLGEQIPIFSFDSNRFTLDAAYGDYFDGSRFVPHPVGGYDRCLEDSVKNINRLWERYQPPLV